MSAIDIDVQDEGTISLVRGVTVAGERWLEENLDPEGQRWGSDPQARVVEYRYVRKVIDGAMDDGLTIQRGNIIWSHLPADHPIFAGPFIATVVTPRRRG